MKYLVDANVLSEPMRPDPSGAVVTWLRHHEREVSVDPIILGEIRFGILLLAASTRRRRLEAWFAEGVARVHCVPWTAETGLRWAELVAQLRAADLTMPVKDSLIAATALAHGFTMVTRNVDDFKKAGLHVIDPFGA